MRDLLFRFWREEDGFVAAGDWVLVASILMLGLAVSAAAVRTALLQAEARQEPAVLWAADPSNPR
jgi:hypothetical protein